MCTIMCTIMYTIMCTINTVINTIICQFQMLNAFVIQQAEIVLNKVQIGDNN